MNVYKVVFAGEDHKGRDEDIFCYYILKSELETAKKIGSKEIRLIRIESEKGEKEVLNGQNLDLNDLLDLLGVENLLAKEENLAYESRKAEWLKSIDCNIWAKWRLREGYIGISVWMFESTPVIYNGEFPTLQEIEIGFKAFTENEGKYDREAMAFWREKLS